MVFEDTPNYKKSTQQLKRDHALHVATISYTLNDLVKKNLERKNVEIEEELMYRGETL